MKTGRGLLAKAVFLFVLVACVPTWTRGADMMAGTPPTLVGPDVQGEAPPARFGVLSFRPKPETQKRWQPLMDYLNQSGLKRKFTLVPLTYPELELAVRNRQVDVVLTQPAHYIVLSYAQGLYSPLATLVEVDGDLKLESFGGVIITRADNPTINNLEDLRGKRVAISSTESLGGYLVQAYELKKLGIDPEADVSLVKLGLPHDQAVDAVLSGKADVGFVRTGLLESLASEGKLDRSLLKVLRAEKVPDYPLALSTPLYPEWALAAMPWLDPELAREVAAAVLSLPHGGAVAKACRIDGFTIPGNYHVVDELMRVLRAPPFDKRDTSLRALWDDHKDAVAGTALGFSLLLSVLLFMLLRVSRKRAYEHDQLEHVSERQRYILDSIGEGLFGTDPQGKTTFVNPAALAMLGFREEEMIGHDSHMLFHHTRPGGGSYPRDQCPIHKTLKDGQTRQEEEWFWCKGGETGIPVQLTVAGKFHKGELVGVVVVFKDITARREMEQELNNHRNHLEHMVKERTAELEKAKLEAQRLARIKSEFLANMSHEIRTPMNAVLGFAHIGQRDSSTRQERENWQRILDAGSLLLSVINDILDISKIEAGKVSIEKRPFRLVTLISNACELVQEAAHQKGISCSRDEECPDLDAWVLGDPLKIQQILTNLLANAVKFTASGEVRLRIAREGDMTYFRVIDTGIGIADEDKARLFRPFEQVDASTTRRYGGTGLGLAISYNLAHLMGGDLTVESAPGQGSSFTLCLPLPLTESEHDSVGDVAKPGELRLKGLSLLIAEDVEVNQLIIQDLLEHEGAVVHLANNGAEALEIWKKAGPGSFDVVLMDIQMPEMDGYEASRRMLAEDPGQPIIGLTAHALEEERGRCLAVGMRDHVTKPIDLDGLVAAINRWKRTGDMNQARG